MVNQACVANNTHSNTRRWIWAWALDNQALGRASGTEASCSTSLRCKSSSPGALVEPPGTVANQRWMQLHAGAVLRTTTTHVACPPLATAGHDPPAASMFATVCSNDAIAVAAGKAMEASSLLPGLPQIDTQVLEAAKMGELGTPHVHVGLGLSLPAVGLFVGTCRLHACACDMCLCRMLHVDC